MHDSIGTKASLIEFDEMALFEPKFVDYVSSTMYPFKNELYMLRTGSRVPKSHQTSARPKSSGFVRADSN